MLKENLIRYRLIIIDEEGKVFPYEREIGKMHHDCLMEFLEEKKLNRMNIAEILDAGCVQLYNMDNGVYQFFMPDTLNDDQIYTLEYLTNFFEGLKELRVDKLDGKHFEFTDNFEKNFSEFVLQSYCDKGKSK